MRSRVLSNRIAFLKKACSLCVLATVAAGCSSGFQRFDNNFYQSAVPQAPQDPGYNNYANYQGSQNNLDTITTASIRRNSARRLTPSADVMPTATQQMTHAPEPTYVTPQATYQPPRSYAQSTYQPPQPQTNFQPPNYQPKPQNRAIQPVYRAPQPVQAKPERYAAAPISTSTLPKVEAPSIAYNPPTPKQVEPQSVYIPPRMADPLTTASVKPSVAPKSGGWSSVGGTTITVREGETLYNLSKRYGVPVSAIQQANNINAETGLQTGQRLVIPNYIFSASSPVSAPDNNPKTRAARASTGYLGEANQVRLPIPTKRPYHMVAMQPQAKPIKVDPVVTNSTVQQPARIKPVVDQKAKAPAQTGISEFRWPVNGRVVSGFGQNGTNGKNEGIDISVPEGTAVKAAENGVVIYAGNEISTYGNLVLVRHADDFVSAYAHTKEYYVKKGDRVSRGQTIARSGKTGSADRPKLHFELRKNSKPVDPRKYLAG